MPDVEKYLIIFTKVKASRRDAFERTTDMFSEIKERVNASRTKIESLEKSNKRLESAVNTSHTNIGTMVKELENTVHTSQMNMESNMESRMDSLEKTVNRFIDMFKVGRVGRKDQYDRDCVGTLWPI